MIKNLLLRKFCHFHLIHPGAVLDLSARGLQKLDSTFSCSKDTYTVILDGNHIMKLDHLERIPWLQQVFKLFLCIHMFTAVCAYLCCFYSGYFLSLAFRCQQPSGENDGRVSADTVEGS